MAVAESLAGSAGASTAQSVAVKPPIGVKLAYCFGQVVESSYLGIAGFIFFYYTAVLGLSGTLVGTALAIAMALDGAFDPLIGSWSDGVRSKLGRRVPVMLVGAPLAMVTMGLLFSPPPGLAPFLMFGWLALTKVGVRAFASMYNIPYFALGGEMSDDYLERSRIVSYRLIAGIVTGVILTALAYSVFFAGVGGLQKPDHYPAFGWTIASIMLVCALICCAGVWRFAANLPQPRTHPDPMLKRLVHGVSEIVRNKSFLSLFFSILIFSSAAGISSALNNHVYVFVWKIRPETIQILAYALLFGILVGTPLTPFLLRFVEKKTAVGAGFALVMLAWMILPILRVTGLVRPTGADALAWLIPMCLILGFGCGIIFIAYPSMMADAADEHEDLFGSRREGLYFAGLGFAQKAAAGVGQMVGGFALDLMHFPRDAGRQIGVEVAESIQVHLIAYWALLPAALSLLGALVFIPYNVNRERHAEITARLRVKRAREQGA
ncbi:MAG TPA: MFS transporter [Phenylobacterium sp.]|jgi:GPH family glycoside/pentoside/hexuronide:cation symporter